MGVTESKFSIFFRLTFRFFKSYSYLINVTATAATPVNYQRHIHYLASVLTMLKNSDDSGVEETGLVTTGGIIRTSYDSPLPFMSPYTNLHTDLPHNPHYSVGSSHEPMQSVFKILWWLSSRVLTFSCEKILMAFNFLCVLYGAHKRVIIAWLHLSLGAAGMYILR